MPDVTRIERIELELKAAREDVKRLEENCNEISRMVSACYRELVELNSRIAGEDPPMMAGPAWGSNRRTL